MATTTTILGTDSISSSRGVINTNFDLVNVDLTALKGLLDTGTESITLTGLAKSGSLEVTNVLTANTSNGVAFTTAAIFNNDVTLKAVKYTSTTAVIILPAANTFANSVYLLNSGSGASISQGLNDGDSGQEIMLVANGGADGFVITPTASNIIGVTTSLTLDGNDFALLRFVNSKWHIINHTGVIV